jgi:serine/threonine-protein kinase
VTWLDDGAVAHLREVAEWPDLGERYAIRGRLGRGGMGVVYAAHDAVIGREVAVKVLDDLLHGASAARLLAEARILGRLEHPGIVPVHDAGTLPDGRVYYVMKLVRGEPLDVAARSRSLNERLDLFLRICETVSFAHARGVVHRDLKPANIMLGAFGEVLVMDWGVALSGSAEAAELGPSAEMRRDAENALGSPGPEAWGPGPGSSAEMRRDAENVRSSPGPESWSPGPEVVGTPGYMAPEQIHGAGDVDHRADVYALGVILAALCTSPAPRPLVAIASRASAAHADRRYQTVQALARDIMRFREGDAVTAYRETPIERTIRLYRRYELPILLVLAYMIMRVLLLAWRGV